GTAASHHTGRSRRGLPSRAGSRAATGWRCQRYGESQLTILDEPPALDSPRKLVLLDEAVVVTLVELRGGGVIDDDGHPRVVLQHGGRAHRGHRPLGERGDGVGLALTGGEHEQVPGALDGAQTL